MRFIELFAGIGGFRLGLEMADQRFKCVYTSEWLPNPRAIYRYHWGGKIDERDVRLIRGEELPEADLLVGGFPCATFSYAGKKTGFCLSDTRGTLCFEMFRIAIERRIPYILFENVKGLLNHDDGKTFAIIISALDEMGYDASWECVDSQYFSVPQHRERIFLIANLREKPFPKVFPLGHASEKDVGQEGSERQGRTGLCTDISPTLDAHYSKGGPARQYVVDQFRNGHFRRYEGEGVPTLTARMGTGGQQVPYLKVKTDVRVRKHEVDIKGIQDLLRSHKGQLSAKQIARKLEVPKSMVEHWFRTDKHFAIPDEDIWIPLKKLLDIKEDKFDAQVTEFIVKDNEFDMANRVYDENGISPTLIAGTDSPFIHMRSHTKANMKQRNKKSDKMWTLDTSPQNKMGVSLDGRDIRKLTPIECERLQGMPDNFTKWLLLDDGTKKLNSDSDRYERCGRTVTSTVIKAIGEKLIRSFYGEE